MTWEVRLDDRDEWVRNEVRLVMYQQLRNGDILVKDRQGREHHFDMAVVPPADFDWPTLPRGVLAPLRLALDDRLQPSNDAAALVEVRAALAVERERVQDVLNAFLYPPRGRRFEDTPS